MMKYYFTFLLTTIICCGVLSAQDRSYSKPGKKHYQELPSAAAKDAEWSKLKTAVNFSFANGNFRYPKERVPAGGLEKQWKTKGWRGEKLHTQLLIWTKTNIPDLSIQVGDLVHPGGNNIPASTINASFVRYVMTDEFAQPCGSRNPADFDSSLSADPIDIIPSITVRANTVQPVWLSVQIPSNAKPGTYRGTITNSADKNSPLTYVVEVIDRILPPASEWTFDLDLWQHPAAVARIHGVPLWSDQHFELMKPYYTMLANAGQKNITASISDEPWGHQTYDDFPTLIKWIKTKNGSWKYDYTLFDKYVSFVMDCGITKRINCYSMVPWSLSFTYYDEAAGIDTMLKAEIGSPEYNAHWTSMLTDFTRHLKQKNWFEKTSMALDERPIEAMKVVINLLKSLDPQWKIASAGNYHPEIEQHLFDYSITANEQFNDTVLSRRLAEGKPTTFYTCCAEKYPNGFTFSPPAENVWIGWFAAAKKYTGYLRWAYNSWVAAPLVDSRFRAWPAGDTYQVYPGPRTSIRFEKLIEGIQDFEKIKILQETYKNQRNTAALKKLQLALQQFEIEKFKTVSAEKMIADVKHLLN